MALLRLAPHEAPCPLSKQEELWGMDKFVTKEKRIPREYTNTIITTTEVRLKQNTEDEDVRRPYEFRWKTVCSYRSNGSILGIYTEFMDCSIPRYLAGNDTLFH